MQERFASRLTISRSNNFRKYGGSGDKRSNVQRLREASHAERERWLESLIRERHAPLLQRLYCGRPAGEGAGKVMCNMMEEVRTGTSVQVREKVS